MPLSMTGSWNISGNVSMDSVATLTAVASATTSVALLQNQAMTSFSPLSSASGGYAPLSYVVQSGILPPGITLNSTTGLVSGTPTTIQNSSPVVFAVQDKYGNQSAVTSTINFAVASLPVLATVGTNTPVVGVINNTITSFYPLINASNGFAPLTYSISSGTLPVGITLDAVTGLVSGTPTVIQGAANVTFIVKDSQNNQAATTVTISFTVNNFSATPGTTTLVTQLQNTAITSFNTFVSINGGYTPYTYYVQSGTLPTGITLDPSTGIVSGTPTVLQTASNVVFAVKDAQNNIATGTLTVTFEVTLYIARYLVVGGGGGGASGPSGCPTYGAGGGGAGGLLQGNVCLVSGGIYNIQVGGAAPFTGPQGNPLIVQGYSSNITGPGISTITTVGGGSGTPGVGGVGQVGGSGGGGGSPGGIGGLATGSPAIGVAGTQGYPGSPGPSFSGGSGGGAGGAGGIGCNPGPGYTWPYNGIVYAQGGRGASFNVICTPKTPGVAGTGQGGNASGNVFGTGGSGGSGTVILAFPNALYPAINSPTATVTTPPAAPGSTVLTFATPSPGIPTSHMIAVNYPGTFATQYLVVGGGGGAGRGGYGGGGGAGGLLQGNILLTANTTYTIQVGAGGAGLAAGPANSGNPGLSSNITSSSPNFGNITTLGGGGGGAQNPSPVFSNVSASLPGGSGGGAGIGQLGQGTASSQPGSPGTLGQGYSGGGSSGLPAPATSFSGGGGGGAGGGGASSCGVGGPGVIFPATGLYYAGGGGGYSYPGILNLGGQGGGGRGGNSQTPGSSSGTPGLGGGGGGSQGCTPSPSGGSGTVIIAVPTLVYPSVSAPGATVSTPPAAPGRTVLTYTTPTPTIPASYSLSIANLSFYNIQYLAVGGGGGGGWRGGGGGGGIATGNTTVRCGLSLSITVGGGGSGVANYNNICRPANGAAGVGTNGNNSSISGPAISTTITAQGGGFGGATGSCGTNVGPGGCGGSGGGAGTAIGTSTQPSQNPGIANLTNYGNPGGLGEGGGGATGVGTTAGGAGYTWPFTGNIYAGGGGKGGYAGSGAGASGPGGGGAGNPGGGGTAPAGTPGLGGGGGGAGTNFCSRPRQQSYGGPGGSGTVILAVPNIAYPTIVAPGAAVSTPPAAPGYTVLTYTAPTPGTPATFTFTT